MYWLYVIVFKFLQFCIQVLKARSVKENEYHSRTLPPLLRRGLSVFLIVHWTAESHQVESWVHTVFMWRSSMVYGHAYGCTLTRGELTMINFMVNRTGTEPACDLAKHHSGCCQWGLLDEISIWIAGWVKQTVLPSRGEHSKKCWLRENSCLMAEPDMALFWPFGPGLKHQLLLSLEPASFQTGIHTLALLAHGPSDSDELQLSWASSLRTARLGTSQPPSSSDPIPHKESLHLYLYTHMKSYWLCFSGESRLTQGGFNTFILQINKVNG